MATTTGLGLALEILGDGSFEPVKMVQIVVLTSLVMCRTASMSSERGEANWADEVKSMPDSEVLPPSIMDLPYHIHSKLVLFGRALSSFHPPESIASFCKSDEQRASLRSLDMHVLRRKVRSELRLRIDFREERTLGVLHRDWNLG